MKEFKVSCYKFSKKFTVEDFVNRIIQLWNKQPLNALGTFPSKPSTFRKRVRKVMSEVKGREF
jgi:hypothetical protein